MTLRILHIADVHIGDRRYGRWDPTRSVNSRLDDQRKCLSYLSNKAIEEKAHAVVIAGDIYHTKSPTPSEEDVFAEFIAQLSENGIHIFAIAGNHERPTSPGRASPLTHIDTLKIPFFHLFTSAGVKSIDIGDETISVVGIPWPLRSEMEAAGFPIKDLSANSLVWDKYISDLLNRLVAEIPENSIPILTAHLWTANIAGCGRYNIRGEPVCRAETLVRVPFRYIALGHVHSHNIVWNSPLALYSGSIDRTDFTESKEKKGAILVEIDGDLTSWTFIETPARPFISIEMDLSGFPKPTESVLERVRSLDLEGAILRILITQQKGDPPIDGRNIRPKLTKPFHIQVLRKVVSEDDKSLLFKAFTPFSALEEYMKRTPEYLPYKDKLMELARLIAEEVSER
ncbi:exonuclease SbcCD subunit D [bacterium]|nr:exonuclease SbcCD subunit D [bacterium]